MEGYGWRVKIYDSFGPNPRALRMVLAEKGLEVERVPVDLFGGENRQDAYVEKNPGGQLPCLQISDGRVIAETLAIFEYLEETHPTPALIGTTAEERAETRMWTRRIELKITEHLYNGFRFAEGIDLFRPRMRVLPEAAAGLKATAQDGLAWLDPLLAERVWIVGDRFTIADIVLFAATDFGRGIGQAIPAGLANVTAWFTRVGARPSAERSLHPQAEAVGMAG